VQVDASDTKRSIASSHVCEATRKPPNSGVKIGMGTDVVIKLTNSHMCRVNWPEQSLPPPCKRTDILTAPSKDGIAKNTGTCFRALDNALSFEEEDACTVLTAAAFSTTTATMKGSTATAADSSTITAGGIATATGKSATATAAAAGVSTACNGCNSVAGDPETDSGDHDIDPHINDAAICGRLSLSLSLSDSLSAAHNAASCSLLNKVAGVIFFDTLTRMHANTLGANMFGFGRCIFVFVSLLLCVF
jgi:hypothetical protein